MRALDHDLVVLRRYDTATSTFGIIATVAALLCPALLLAVSLGAILGSSSDTRDQLAALIGAAALLAAWFLAPAVIAPIRARFSPRTELPAAFVRASQRVPVDFAEEIRRMNDAPIEERALGR